MAAYEIFYKRLAMIPHDELRGSFQPLSSDELSEHAPQGEIEGELPFGLHPITMMTGIGAMTLCLFWIPLLVSHLFGIERMEWPGVGLHFYGFYLAFSAAPCLTDASLFCFLSGVPFSPPCLACSLPFWSRSPTYCLVFRSPGSVWWAT